jgi:TRAP-type C4-dicarboxylate transport system substrate-binding protein
MKRKNFHTAVCSCLVFAALTLAACGGSSGNGSSGGAAFMMAPTTWNKLTAEQKAAVVTVAKTSTTENRKFCEERETSARKQMIEQYSLQVVVPKDMQQFRNKAKSVYDKYSQLTDLVKQIDSYRK